MIVTSAGRATRGHRDPTVSRWIVTGAGVHDAAIVPAPDNHLGARPHRAGHLTCSGREGSGRGRPAIADGIVTAPGVQVKWPAAEAAPDDHLGTCPHRRMVGANRR